ncbi:MAG TPA: hypothetical protein PLG78_20005, partial [Leptospiraceae bacterium]|nr:hypothetical protein [Leptospiraceae bacterium]
MEWLLLLLAGGVAAGVGLWAVRPSPGEQGSSEGPSSSPGLPGVKDDRGTAVPLGGKDTTDQIRDLLAKAPDKIQAKGVSRKQEPSRSSKVPLRVTYNTDQLIARSSRFAHHRRALQNAEILVSKQKATEALEVFERVANRVQDADIQSRIQTNIDDIRRWLSGFESEDDQLKFPEIVIPLTLQNLALENLTEGIKNLSDSIVQKIAESVAAVSAISVQHTSPSGGYATSSPGSAPASPSASAPASSPASAPSAYAATPGAPAQTAMPGQAPGAAIPTMGAAYAVPATADM